MAEQTMAERPTAEKIAPWWQRILRRAVDGLRSGFGLFRRSQAPSSRTGEELSNGNVEAEDSGARSIAAEPPRQDEAELQIAEKKEDETELNRTFPHSESNSTAAEEQAKEAAAAEQAEQAEALPSAANEPIVIAAPETQHGPDPQGREAEASAPETAEAIESVPDAASEEVTREETIVAEIEGEEIPDLDPIEIVSPAQEEHEAVEPNPPCEEGVVAESGAVADAKGKEPDSVASSEEGQCAESAAGELPARTGATEEPDATQPADQAIKFAHEEDQNPDAALEPEPSFEDAALSQAKDAPEEGVVTEPAEPEKPLEIEPAHENASFETVDPRPMEAGPDQEETQAEAVAALETEPAFEDAPVVDDNALVVDECIVTEESIGTEELPQPDGTLPEAIPVAEETNIDLVEETNIEGEGTIDAEPEESFPVSALTEAHAAESEGTLSEAIPVVEETNIEGKGTIDAEPEEAHAAEPETPVAEPETAVAEPEVNASEPEAPVSAPEVNASQQEAVVAAAEVPSEGPNITAAEPPQPVAEPIPPSTSPVPAEPTAEERKKSEKVAAAMKARSQTEEQSPFSVAVGKIYEGPLDLLLDLIRKQDIDIYDIPIAKITAQFLAYVDRLRAGDMDVAGDFIYTAALLIHIKSKMLLPREPAGPDDQGDDPRHELVERLLEHERFKNAAQMLQQKQLLEAATWTRPGLREFGEEADAEPEIAADTVDLVRVFREVLERAANRPVLNLEEDAVTVGQMIRFLARRLNMDDRPVALRRLLSQTQSERMLIAMFLALLEMVRLQAVLLRQDRQFSEIFVKKHTGFDALMGEGLENAKDDWR